MCKIFSGQPYEDFRKRTRSVRIGGVVRSIQLENKFWSVLEDLSRSQGMTLAAFLTALHDEACQVQGDPENFASLLRCSCLVYVTMGQEKTEAA
ncbi:ribbon-helix-helix domain-containing protein [Faunimonas sp. B44]|uniref:ribbon-helix-helix domain-containing protein n=1 Tax=Faunimonas sp. B44 TaxID=3461493 RepID=UPI00404402C1